MKKIKNITITRSGNGAYFSNSFKSFSDKYINNILSYYTLKNYHVTIAIYYTDNTSIFYDNSKDSINIDEIKKGA